MDSASCFFWIFKNDHDKINYAFFYYPHKNYFCVYVACWNFGTIFVVQEQKQLFLVIADPGNRRGHWSFGNCLPSPPPNKSALIVCHPRFGLIDQPHAEDFLPEDFLSEEVFFIFFIFSIKEEMFLTPLRVARGWVEGIWRPNWTTKPWDSLGSSKAQFSTKRILIFHFHENMGVPTGSTSKKFKFGISVFFWPPHSKWAFKNKSKKTKNSPFVFGFF